MLTMGGDIDDEIESMVVNTTIFSKTNNKHTNNKIVKTTKSPNEIQPTTNLLNLVY